MTPEARIEAPSEWRTIPDAGTSGIIMVIGGPDTGKSTFVRWLVQRLSQSGRKTAWIDCDIGQSILGLPTTLNLALLESPPAAEPTASASFFIGATSPRGHMLPLLVGTERLKRRAASAQAACTVIDTTGMVSVPSGGGALKQWKIELLQPDMLIAFAHERELDHILLPLEMACGTAVRRLKPPPAVRPRTTQERECNRRRKYRHYFTTAARQRIGLAGLPVYNAERVVKNTLVSIQDDAGFSLALGICLSVENDVIEVLTPLAEIDRTAGLRFGGVSLDPHTWKEQRVGSKK